MMLAPITRHSGGTVRALVVWAVIAAAVAAVLQALLVAFGLHVPTWALVALPAVAACVAFLFAGRRRAVRLQRERLARSGRPRRPEAVETRRMRRGSTDAGDLALVRIHVDDGALER
jgi:hypothetical protein